MSLKDKKVGVKNKMVLDGDVLLAAAGDDLDNWVWGDSRGPLIPWADGKGIRVMSHDHCHQAPCTPAQGHRESGTMGGKILNIGFEAVLDIISLIARPEAKDDTSIPL